jgi:hypothetical protein
MEFEAELLRQIADQESQKLRLEEKYQLVAADAIVTGVCFISSRLRPSNAVLLDQGNEIDPGEVCEEVHDFDDYAPDPIAKTRNQFRMEAVRYRVSRRQAIQEKVFGRDPGELPPGTPGAEHVMTRSEAAEILSRVPGIERTDPKENAALSQSPRGETEEDQDTIELWDVFVKCYGKVYTVTLIAQPSRAGEIAGAPNQKYLSLIIEPTREEGPLDALWFLPVPNNIQEISIEQWQRDIAVCADLVTNKLINQFLRTKRNVIYRGDEDEALTAKEADDGEWIKSSDPTQFTELGTGTIMSDLMSAMPFLTENWNNVTGNLQLAGGANAIGNNKTATAFEGLAEKVQGWLHFLRSKVEGLATRQLRRRMWFARNNPTREWRIPTRISPDVILDILYSAADAEGTLDDVQFDAQAYSMQHRDPAIEAREIMEYITTGLPSLLAMSAQFGLNAVSANRLISRKMGWREMDQIVPDAVLMQQRMLMMAMAAQGGMGAGPGGAMDGGMQPGMGMPPGGGMGGGMGMGGPGAPAPTSRANMRRSTQAPNNSPGGVR